MQKNLRTTWPWNLIRVPFRILTLFKLITCICELHRQIMVLAPWKQSLDYMKLFLYYCNNRCWLGFVTL